MNNRNLYLDGMMGLVVGDALMRIISMFICIIDRNEKIFLRKKQYLNGHQFRPTHLQS